MTDTFPYRNHRTMAEVMAVEERIAKDRQASRIRRMELYRRRKGLMV
jgi:hypothetical protein